MQLPTPLAPLKNRDFRIYWVGQAISLTGTWMQIMAQSWVLTGLSANARDLGLNQIIASLPILLLSLKAGEFADRYDKRKILLITQFGLMILAFVFAACIAQGWLSITLIFVMSALLGLVAAFDLPAAQSLPPELVSPPEISGAVAMMQQIFHGARLVGPALAGVLIAAFGNLSAFIANGISYSAVIISLLLLSPVEKRAGSAKKPATGGFNEGVQFVRKDPVVRPLMLLALLTTGTVFPFLAVLMAYYVRRVMNTDDASVAGTVMSMTGLGSFLGASAILWGKPESRRYWLAAAMIGASVAILVLASYPLLSVAVPVAAILAFWVASLLGRLAQMVQERVPAQLRGRVMSVFTMAWTGLMPFAALGLSTLADAIGYPFTMKITAIFYVIAALSVLAASWSAIGSAPALEPILTKTE